MDFAERTIRNFLPKVFLGLTAKCRTHQCVSRPGMSRKSKKTAKNFVREAKDRKSYLLEQTAKNFVRE